MAFERTSERESRNDRNAVLKALYDLLEQELDCES